MMPMTLMMDGMKAAAIIALMRIIYGKDDDPREPASMLMMALIENYGSNDGMDSSDDGDERDEIKQNDEPNADDNRKIRFAHDTSRKHKLHIKSNH